MFIGDQKLGFCVEASQHSLGKIFQKIETVSRFFLFKLFMNQMFILYNVSIAITIALLFVGLRKRERKKQKAAATGCAS